MARIDTTAEINTARPEGRLLVAALEILVSESLTPKSSEDFLKKCNELADHMYGPIEATPPTKEPASY